MNAPITYIPHFINDPDKVLSILQNELDWERRDNTPRCEYYCNDFDKPYIYGIGKGQREYLSKPYHTDILNIRSKIEENSIHLGHHSNNTRISCRKKGIWILQLPIIINFDFSSSEAVDNKIDTLLLFK